MKTYSLMLKWLIKAPDTTITCASFAFNFSGTKIRKQKQLFHILVNK